MRAPQWGTHLPRGGSAGITSQGDGVRVDLAGEVFGSVGSAKVTTPELTENQQLLQRFMCIVVFLVLPCIVVALGLPSVSTCISNGYFSCDLMCKFSVRLGLWIVGYNLLVFAHHLHQRENIEEITARKRLARKIYEETKPQIGLVRALGVANITFVYHFACFWTLREIIDPQTNNPNEGIASQFQRIFEYVVDVAAVVILIAHAPARHAPC